MADGTIKRMFVRDGQLHLVQDSAIVSVKAVQGKEPNEWTPVHFAAVGTSEEFIEVLTGEIPELVDGSLIFGGDREAVKFAIADLVIEGLMPAFEHLRKIRLSVTNPLPELNRRQLYEDFACVLWRAYKDRFAKAVSLLGFNIGFLFLGDALFDKGLTDFVTKYPSLIVNVPELMKRQRVKWQQALHVFRNDFLEHRKEHLTIGEFAAFYEPRTAEMLFDHAWRTMAELFPALIEARFPPTWSIMEIPVQERNQSHPRRWRHVQCERTDRGIFTR